MSSATRLLTAEEYYGRFPKESELLDGIVRPKSLMGMQGGDCAAMLGCLLSQFILLDNLGVAVVNTGFILRRNPDTVLGPTIAFVSRESLKEVGGVPDGFFPSHPDLAIEVLSHLDTPSALADKARHYLAAGTPLVWIVDPQSQTVAVNTRTGTPRTLVYSDTLTAPDLFPGLSLPLSEVFA
jgi:Uma2 family endonuclease